MYNRLDSIPACDRQTDGKISCHGIVRAMHTRRAVIKNDMSVHIVYCRPIQDVAAVVRNSSCFYVVWIQKVRPFIFAITSSKRFLFDNFWQAGTLH